MNDQFSSSDGNGGGSGLAVGLGFVAIVACIGVMLFANANVPDKPIDPMLAANATEGARRDAITQTAQGLAGEALRMAQANGTATAVMAEKLAQYQREQQAEQTQTAQKLAEQQAQAAREQAEQQARAQETERSWQITQQAMALEAGRATDEAARAAEMLRLQAQGTTVAQGLEATATAAQVYANATQAWAAAGIAVEAHKREENATAFMTWFKPLAPVVISLMALGLTALVLWRAFMVLQRTQIVRPDERGTMPVIIQDGKIIAVSRSLGPLLDPSNHTAAPDDVQLQITSQAQKVEALRALPAQLAEERARSVANEPQPQPATQAAPVIRVINPANDEVVDGWVREVTEKYLTGGTK